MAAEPYKCVEGTLETGNSDHEIDLSDSGDALDTLYISNITNSNKNFSIKINSASNDAITIYDGTYLSLGIGETKISKIYITNTSGATVSYQIVGVY